MMKKIWEHRKQEGGFTLVELLVVISILGILAAVAVFAVGGITDKGTNSACKSDVKAVETAQEARFAQQGSYAGTVAALTPTWLRSAPSSTAYTISTSTSGAVTVSTPGGGTSCPS